MVQPQYSPTEALNRIKLMMSYDMSKTLNENKETIKEPINEIAPLVIAGITIAPWLYSTTAAGIAAIGTWIYNTQGGGDSFAKTQSFFAGCSKNMKDLKPTVSKSEYRAAADSIYNAIEGIGTDTNAIKAALNSMPTVSDLCALNSWYSTQYGDLYDDLDSDIDGTDFTKYVWSAIAPKIADAEDDLEKVKTGGKTGGGKTGGKTPGKSAYKPCSGTYSYGCKSNTIAKVQGCLGLTPDGKFGKKTKAALASKGVTSFTDADVTKICSSKQPVKPQTDEFSVQADADDSLSLLNT
jgi:hypothetical protein